MGTVVSIILRESQEMKKHVLINENPGEKVIGMQTIHQQGLGYGNKNSKLKLYIVAGQVSVLRIQISDMPK